VLAGRSPGPEAGASRGLTSVTGIVNFRQVRHMDIVQDVEQQGASVSR
jgi:hypothetical protein